MVEPSNHDSDRVVGDHKNAADHKRERVSIGRGGGILRHLRETTAKTKPRRDLVSTQAE